MTSVFLGYALSKLISFSNNCADSEWSDFVTFIDKENFVHKLMWLIFLVVQFQVGGSDLYQALNAVQESSTEAILFLLPFCV